jgi:hypothetical protein
MGVIEFTDDALREGRIMAEAHLYVRPMFQMISLKHEDTYAWNDAARWCPTLGWRPDHD